MAEIGLVASIIQILSVAANLSTSLYSFAESIGSAGLEVEIIAKEITLFSAVLNQLRDVLEHCSNQYSVNLMQTVEEILDESREGFGRISSVLRQLKIGGNAGKPAEFARRMKFLFVRSKINLFRGYLESNKSTLQTMLQVLLIRKRFPSLSPKVKSDAIRIEQERELLDNLVVANRLSFVNLRKLEKGPGAYAIRSSRNEQDGRHPPLPLSFFQHTDREHEHGMVRPRSSIGSTASRISEHRSLLEENPEGAVDCLLQRWTAGACETAEHNLTPEHSQSVAAQMAAKISANSRPRTKRVPFRSGEWIPDEVNSDDADEDVVDTEIATLPSIQPHEQSEERYKAQAKQMVSSRNWIVESYGARLHVLTESMPSGHAEAFQKLRDLFEKLLVDLYWERGFADSAPQPSTVANIEKDQAWRLGSSKQPSSVSRDAGTIAKSPGRTNIANLFRVMLRHYSKAATTESVERSGTTDSDTITVSQGTSEGTENPDRYSPHPVTTLVDRMPRSSLDDVLVRGRRANTRSSQALYNRTRDVLSAKLGEKSIQETSSFLV